MIKAFISVAFCYSGTAAAQDCVAPVSPQPSDYVIEEMHEFIRGDYQLYFDDVEIYLNCINRSGAQIRHEAQQAAEAFDRLLNKTTPRIVGSERSFNTYAGPLTKSGTLNLDYRP